MADNLIFPIGFDLDKAVEQAGKDWDGKFADKLEKLIAKKPVNVKLKLDTKNLDSLDAVKKRLAELKVEPITPETKSAIKELTSELRQLAKALETLQKYSKNPTKGAVDTSKVQLNEARAKAQAALAAQRTAKAEDNLAAARLKAARAANVHASATRNASKAYGEQSTYLDRLTQRLAVYWSVRQVSNFLSSVRDVTAEFELQRVSLGAIIQDQQMANALFSEIKSFALKSPVSIMDLTKYTKQLAAYKIETEELFETTKKLTDVSVGLGVGLDRVILAYGQTRATGYLRASEIRQFTEMGVPIVEELASKLSKMNGELVTAAQVMDMVSKRGISFELVKEVFDDMTSAGGMFYNMQENQGNTLFGLWAKLGDAASVMYDEIGNTEWVNKGMKDLIQLLTNLMKNWRLVAGEITVVASLMAGIVIRNKANAAATAQQAAMLNKVRAAGIAYNAILREEATLLKTGTAAQLQSVRARKANAKAALDAAIAERTAAASTNIWTRSMSRLKEVFMGNWAYLLVTAVASLGVYIYNAVEKANRLKNTLADIGTETGVEISRMVTNFESLAKKAVDAADGSREQKDALSELQRTYRNIIPEQNLTIEKLREMKGEYTNLTIAIREYIREQQLEKGMSAIVEEYGSKLIKEERKLKKKLETTAIGSKGGAGFYLDENQIDRIVVEFKRLVNEGKSAQDALREAFRLEGVDNLVENYTELADKLGLVNKAHTEMSGSMSSGGLSINTFEESVAGLTKVLQDQDKATKDWQKQMDGTVQGLGKLTPFLEEAKKTISEFKLTSKENTFAFDTETAKVTVDAYVKAFQDAIDQTDVKLDLSQFVTLDTKGIKHIDFEGINDLLKDVNSQWAVALQKFSGEVQSVYEEFIPKDKTVASLRNVLEQIAGETGASMDVMRRYQMKSGDNWVDYSKSIEDSIKQYEDSIDEMVKANAAVEKGGVGPLKTYSAEEIEKANTEMKTLIFLLEYLNKTSSSGRTSQSDPRLGILQEMVSTLKQVNKEYDDLAKKEGATKALADTQKTYADTFKNMQALAKQYKFDLPGFGVPTDTASLTKYLDAIKKAMAKLPKSDKAVSSLQVDIDKLNIDEKQKQIEEELKRLADRVARTKTAQEFYDKILGATGDINIAANVTMSIYGDAGTDVQAQMAEYIFGLFGGFDVEVPVSVISSEGDIDYTSLEKFVRDSADRLGGIESDTYKELIKIAQDGQKNMAKTYEGYLKDLEVAKTYADKRIELARDTANKIAEIERSKLPQAEKDRLKAGYTEREAREAAKLEYEAFKDTPLYTQMFEDLDYASTSALTRMRDRLVTLKGQWKNLDPTQLKELQKRLDEIDNQLATRNPFKALTDSFKQWNDLRKSGRTIKGDELAADTAETARQEAEKKMIADEKAYQVAVKESGAMSDAAKAARETADASKDAYEKAENTANETAKSADEWKDIGDKIKNAVSGLDEYQQGINDALGGIRNIMDAFGVSDEDMQFFDDIVGGFNKVVDGGKQAAGAVASFMSGDIFGGVTKSISAIVNLVSGFMDIFNAGRIRNATKEIKKQQEELEQFEYTYGRLQKAAEDLFGSDYIQNFNQQLEALRAQAEAYQKQAEAEKSKGKKKDEEKVKDFEQSYQETMDEIEDRRKELVEHFAGSDLTSAARDWARAWIDAKTSFSSTTDAMKERFADMMKNMIVESMAASVMKQALKPFYDELEKAMRDEKLSAEDIVSLSNIGLSSIDDANAAMELFWNTLKDKGIDIKEMFGEGAEDLTGISRDIASASEESINGLAAGINTQNFYVSHLPKIAENVLAMRMLMESGGMPSSGGMTMTDLVTMQNQHLSQLPVIAANTAEMVVRCERAAAASERSAAACENISLQLGRVIRPKGTPASHSVSTTIN